MVKKKATTNTVIPPAARREQRVVAAARLSLARRSHLPQPKTPFINDILVNCELDVQGRSYCANIYGLCYARS